MTHVLILGLKIYLSNFMRLALIIALTLFLWSGSVSLKVKPQIKSAEPNPVVCRNTKNGEPLLQTMSKGTISGIHDNGRELIIGIPGNWADFPSEDQKTTIHRIQCYAKELNRQLQFVHAPKPPAPANELPLNSKPASANPIWLLGRESSSYGEKNLRN